MLKTALAVFLAGCITASGQAPKGASGGAEKVDRAAAYYHYTLAHLYAEMAASSESRSHEYINKSIKNYKAAVKADPHTPALLQGPDHLPVLWLPAAQPSRTLRKANPSR